MLGHRIKYEAIDNDFDRFTEASVDGFQVTFGDVSDLRFANTMSMNERTSIVITNVRMDRANTVMPIVRERFPNLIRFAAVPNEAAATEVETLGMQPVVERGGVPGLSMVEQVLKSQGVEDQIIQDWVERRRQACMTKAEPVIA